MTRLRLRPYREGDGVPPNHSVPISVVILARDEELNIRRCLNSVAWARQVIVVDSGSTDSTVAIARSGGAEIVHQPWLGFSAQREFALRLSILKHDWIYFVDADEWISRDLATEVARCMQDPRCAAFTHRLRLVFLGTWIRHCGWYRGSWVVRILDRRYTKYDGSLVGERACIDGPVRRLRNDIVDDDLKGLSIWLTKHVKYAQLEARRRRDLPSFRVRARTLMRRSRADTKPIIRAFLKDLVYPIIPFKPLMLFIFMYVIRLGFADGRAGLRFCFYHAWFEVTVATLRLEERASRQNALTSDRNGKK